MIEVVKLNLSAYGVEMKVTVVMGVNSQYVQLQCVPACVGDNCMCMNGLTVVEALWQAYR